MDPNMRIARVRTEDGRNITVRHKDLKRSVDQLSGLGGPPRRVSSPRLRPGSTLGLGLGAFFVSRLPLSLLPMKPNITRMTFQSEIL